MNKLRAMNKWISIILVLVAVHSFAQESLTLDQFISRVLENDFGIKIIKNEALIAENNNNPGAAGYLPTIALSAEQNWTINSARQEFLSGQVNEATNAQNRSFTAGVMLNWTFFHGFKMFITDKKLNLLEESARINLVADMEMKIYQASVSFYTLLLLQKMEELYKESIALSNARFEMVTNRSNAGAASAIEALQVRLDLTADSSAYLDNKKAMQLLKVEMNRLMANDTDSEFQIIGEFENELTPMTWDEVRNSAIEQNSSVLQTKAMMAIREKEHKEVLSRYYPQLAFYAGYNFGSSRNQVGFLLANQSYGPQFGLTLRWDILDGLARMTGSKNAKIAVENAEFAQQQQLLQIDSELKTAFIEYDWAISTVRFERRNAMESQQMYQILNDALKAGRYTPLELREMQFTIMLAKSRALVAQLNYITARMNIALATGDFKRLLP